MKETIEPVTQANLDAEADAIKALDLIKAFFNGRADY